MKVPELDLARLHDASSPTDRAAALAELDGACREWGVFQILNHGIPQESIDEFFRRSAEFFALPRARKLEIERTEDNPFGYYDRELTKRRPDRKQVFDCASPRIGRGAMPVRSGAGMRPADENQWPAQCPALEPAVLRYIDACEALAFQLLGWLCECLGLEPRALDAHFADRHTSFLRVNFYPSSAEPAAADTPWLPARGDLGVHHHTDAGALTIVAQDEVDSLQVHREDRWHLVELVPGALVVNLADMLQVWTNDRYRSPLHRVLSRSDRERLSAPFFFNPAYSTDCRPLPTLLAGGQAARYRTVNWGEFRRLRTDGDFADVGEEVQIAHYRV